MSFSAEMLAEFEKPGGEYYKRLTINFPQSTEVVTLQPDATELADTNHAPVTAGTIHEALDDPPATPNDDTDYVRHDANDTSAESYVSFPSLPSWVVEVKQVRVYCRARSNVNVDANEDDGGWYFAARVNSTNYFGAIEHKRFFNPAYQTMVIKFDQNPDTDADWTVTDVNALQVAILSQPDGFGDAFGIRFTQVYVEVEATREQVGRYSDVTLNSRSDGLYQSKVTRWGSVSYSVAGTSGAIQRPSFKCSLADVDEDLSQLFAGSGVDEVRRATCVLEYVSPNVAKANWGPVFTGILESWNETRPHEWELSFAQDDSSLDGVVPKAKISEIDFGDADPKEYDKFIQIIYGRHISEGLTDDGMVPCPNVDTVQFRRLVAAHRVKTISKVYSKGNREDPAVEHAVGYAAGNATTAGYQILTPVVGGRQYTILEFNVTSQQDEFNERTVAVDVEGIEDVGDGTGFLITNPAQMFKHFFVNFVANEYGSGNWLPDSSAPVDATTFEETRLELNRLGQESSRFIGGSSSAVTGRRELNAFCSDLNLRAFWTEEGNLAILPNTPFTLDVYVDDPWFIQGLHDLTDPSFRYDTSGLFDRVLLSHFHQANGNQFLANIEVRDFEAQDEKVETINSFWLPSGLVSS